VLLAINSLVCGGAEAQLVRLAAHLRANDHTVAVMTLLPGDHHLPALTALDVPVHEVDMHPRLRAGSSVAGARAIIQREQPDVVISFLYQATMATRLACAGPGAPPHIASMRDEHFGGRLRDLALRLTDRLSVRTVVNSHVTAARLVDRGVVSANRARVVPNGLDPSTFELPAGTRGETRRELGVADESPGQTFVWLGIGRLQPQKSWDVLLDAIAALPPEIRNRQQWYVVGEGPLEQQLKDQAEQLAISDRVRFLGPRSDVPRLFAASDALVLSSWHEGMPNVVLEAMAARRPVVATNVGAVRELVEDGTTGLVVSPRQPAALAKAMHDLASRPSEDRTAMGDRARAVVDEGYTLSATMPLWSALLTDCGLTADPQIPSVAALR
jgi:glycosyltransferase involved in cell wall biosynthesis